MKLVLAFLLCGTVTGCRPEPVPKATHVQQVKRTIARAGGEEAILKESQILFQRCASNLPTSLFQTNHSLLAGLSAIKSLGDVFYPESGYFRIRVYNNHFDVFFIDLVDPSRAEPAHFDRITGNVGFAAQGAGH